MVAFRVRVALIGILAALSAISARNSAAQSSTITAFYTAPVVSMAPMWIAKEAGFFKKQGLEVRLVFIASGPLGTTSILSGDVDVGVIGGFAPIRAISGGAKNLVIIGQTKNRMTGAIVGKKDIADVRELKGKRLGIDRVGSNPDMFTQAALARFNMDPFKDLNYIQLGTIGQGIPALKAGTIEALSTSAPHDLFAQRLGFKVILDITALKSRLRRRFSSRRGILSSASKPSWRNLCALMPKPCTIFSPTRKGRIRSSPSTPRSKTVR
jgi:NitT/TauT family transport system substrate-binding protein